MILFINRTYCAIPYLLHLETSGSLIIVNAEDSILMAKQNSGNDVFKVKHNILIITYYLIYPFQKFASEGS